MEKVANGMAEKLCGFIQKGVHGVMTALEYMEKQVQKHSQTFEREFKRGVPNKQLFDIMEKISHYKAAAEALRREN